jgi:hypothetical protein
LWILIALAALGALVWVIRHQVDLREQAEQQRAREEADKQAALEAHRAAQPTSGTVTIDSEPDGAAVWMLLGRTPIDTQALPSDMVHQVRVVQDGFVTQDVNVTGFDWTGTGESRKATVRVPLEQGRNRRVPAAPKAPSKDDKKGLERGSGVITIDTEPSGAEAWLLVGFTPGVEIAGHADVEKTFKLRKQGYAPAVAIIKATDWKPGAGGKRAERTVKLRRSKR